MADPGHLYAYVSGHGFGHATRSIAVLGALRAHRPGLRVTVVSEAPGWLFRAGLGAEVACVRRPVDVGCVQPDAFRVDVAATLARTRRLLARLPERVRDEAVRAARDGATLVYGDIPAVAFLVADALGVPSVALGNFSWDWIYSDYLRRGHPDFADVVAAHRAAYARAHLLLRLPLHGGLGAFPRVRDVPLVVRAAHRTRRSVLAEVGYAGADPRPVVLLSFGGLGGGALDPRRLTAALPYRFVTYGDADAAPAENLRVLRHSHPTPHPEVVRAADVVVSKPGYGIVSECVAFARPLLYVDRADFREYAVLVDGLRRLGRGAPITRAELSAGALAGRLQALLAGPPPPPPPRTDGARVAARAIAELAGC